jgi:hypothetical protein
MKRIFCYIAALCSLTPVSWAMFCNTAQGPNGWIETGMSSDAIIAACGQPDSIVQIITHSILRNIGITKRKACN